MILEISGSSEKVIVEITSAGGTRKIRIADNEIPCDCVRLSEGHYSLILDGHVFDMMVNLEMDTCTVTSRTGTLSFRITDSRHTILRPRVEDGPAGLQRVLAEMPGKIVSVMVREGEAVVCDQGLLVLEAMKMQNEIRAPKSGTIKEVAVSGGTTVGTGDFLLSIES